MGHFTHEEIALMHYYDSSSLASMLAALKEDQPHTEDELALEAITSCIQQLSRMSEAEFAALQPEILHPVIL